MESSEGLSEGKWQEEEKKFLKKKQKKEKRMTAKQMRIWQ